MRCNKPRGANSNIRLLKSVGSGLKKGQCGESEHYSHLRLDVGASVSAWVSGCGTGRGGNGGRKPAFTYTGPDLSGIGRLCK